MAVDVAADPVLAVRRALDTVRYHKRRPVQTAPPEGLPGLPAADDTETAALDSLSTHAALALIARLPRDQAEIIVLRVVVGLEVKAGHLTVDPHQFVAHRGHSKPSGDNQPPTPARPRRGQ